MKVKTFSGFMAILFLMSMIFVPAAFAVKPKNLASAEKIPWHLSGDVMPVPPYGSRDISGSDTASKLIVNQPNGNTEVTITGAMNGLNPNTKYTVYISKAWSPQTTWPGLFNTGWNIKGSWIIRFNLGSNYDHDIVIDVQDDGTFSGYGGYPAGGPPYSITETVTGTIDVMSGAVTFHSDYDNTGYWYDAEGTIAVDGTMSGTWGNDGQGYGHSWTSISGNAVKRHTVPTFTFMTDEYGAGSWHLNLRDEDFSGEPGTYILSVWINEAGRTMLISDNFKVEVD